jgi:glycosyltransferase involved in cell wall biosynthesis
METAELIIELPQKKRPSNQDHKPFLSLVVPAYNEGTIIEENLTRLCTYMISLEHKCRWELVIINDGSIDNTGEIAEKFAAKRKNVHVFHHITNFRVGQAFRTAFKKCRGDYIVTLDVDLSYAPEHIERLFNKICQTKAHIVIASPYMKGGKVSNVPWLRKKLSLWANRFLFHTVKGNLHTITGMVRIYDRKFLNMLNLKAVDMEINLEIIYKAMLLRARIEEIPAHLDWGSTKDKAKNRISSFRIASGIIEYLLSGFIFKPFMFFVIPGFILLMLSLYSLLWVIYHIIDEYYKVAHTAGFFDTITSVAVSAAFQTAPHSFFVAGISLIVAIQLLSLGIVSYQSKRYFEEIFHINSNIYKQYLSR